MSHPLDGCHLRIQRSDRYIKEAHALLQGFARECEDRILASLNQDGPNGPIYFPDAPIELPLAISDCVHNLRAALDYLVYELALKDSGSIQEGTQFPIEITKSAKTAKGNPYGFDAVADRYLAGVSRPHRDMIERLQPYNGRDWILDLKDISNPDKHRKLTPIKTLDELVCYGFPNGEGKRLPNGDAIYVEPAYTVQIELRQRRVGITQTLYQIQGCTVDAINLFKPEF